MTTYKTRHEQRIELFAVFIREITQMDTELVEMLTEFVVSMSILYLVFEGQTASYIGVPIVAVLMSIDFARIIEAWKRAKIQAENEPE